MEMNIDYISRETAKAEVRKKFPGLQERCEINEVLNSIPAAEVKPVVWGKWVEFDEDSWECSNCGQLWTLNDGTPKENSMNFCPSCGADMCE